MLHRTLAFVWLHHVAERTNTRFSGSANNETSIRAGKKYWIHKWVHRRERWGGGPSDIPRNGVSLRCGLLSSRAVKPAGNSAELVELERAGSTSGNIKLSIELEYDVRTWGAQLLFLRRRLKLWERVHGSGIIFEKSCFVAVRVTDFTIPRCLAIRSDSLAQRTADRGAARNIRNYYHRKMMGKFSPSSVWHLKMHLFVNNPLMTLQILKNKNKNKNEISGDAPTNENRVQQRPKSPPCQK